MMTMIRQFGTSSPLKYERLCININNNVSNNAPYQSMYAINFWITFFHFPLNFISTLSVGEIAGWLRFPNGYSVAIVLDSDDSRAFADWQCHWFPCASCADQTELTVCFAALIVHVTVPGEKKKKGRLRVFLRAQGGLFFPSCSFAWHKARIKSQSMTQGVGYLHVCALFVVNVGAKSALAILFLPVWARWDERLLLLIR